jgi:putative sterol carrier protein
MGLVGLMNVLKLEGAKYDIKVNTVAPLAASRLTQDVLPPDLFAKMKPEFVAPLVLGLCSEPCPVSGQIFNCGMGYGSRAAIVSAPAVKIGAGSDMASVEDIAEDFDRIDRLDGAVEIADATTAILNMINPPAAQGPAPAAVDAADSAVESVFANMAKAFRPEAATGVDVVFQYDITGPGGGKWFCQVKDGACTVGAGTHGAPACILTMAAADFLAMMGGALSPMAAYTGGKLRIGGDVMKSQLIQKLFKI